MVSARRGFSLVEVIVALTLLSIGLLGVAGSGLLATRLMRETQLREEVLSRANNLLDSLVSHDAAGSGTVARARYQLDWEGTDRGVEVRATLDDTLLLVLRVAR